MESTKSYLIDLNKIDYDNAKLGQTNLLSQVARSLIVTNCENCKCFGIKHETYSLICETTDGIIKDKSIDLKSLS